MESTGETTQTESESLQSAAEDSGANGDKRVEVGLTEETLRRMRDDPFLDFDASDVEENAYFRWVNGAPGGALAHWLAAETEEIFAQVCERLEFAGTERNGFRNATLYDHFRLVTAWRCGALRTRKILGPRTPRRCCFCGEGEPLRTFKTEAHVIPEMFGCRDLLTNEECDQCNAESGRVWEAELGHFTLGDRAFGGVRKKTSAVPKIKVGPGSYIGGQKAGAAVNIVSMGREIARVTGPNTAEIDLPHNAARPARAAKAIAKMAWLMLSPEQRINHQGVGAWLAGQGDCETQVYHVWMACRVPTTVTIWEPLGDDHGLAELVVMLAFGNVMLLWAPPDWETGAARDLLMPPFPRGAAVNSSLTARRYNAEEHTRTKAGSRTIKLSFETMWRVHLTAPTPVEVVVREGEKESRLLTTAISPPDATPEQPHFQLRGGDLVGSIEVKTKGESWSWSYQARPSDGDAERTIEVMNAVARGGSVSIACTSDHQLILNVDRFDRPGDDNRDASPLVEMAYNVGVVNRRFGLKLEMAEFSDDDLDLARWLALGVIHGAFQEEEPEGERSVFLGTEAVETLAATVGKRRQNISFRNEDTRCRLFATDIAVGQTQLVLFDARVVGDWEALIADARAHSRVFVTFECSRVGHIFDDMFTGR